MEHDKTAGMFLCPGWEAPMPQARQDHPGGGSQTLRAEFRRKLGALLEPDDFYFCFRDNTNISARTIRRQAESASGKFYLGYQDGQGNWQVFRLDKEALLERLERKAKGSPGYRGIPITGAFLAGLEASGLGVRVAAEAHV